MKILIVLSFIAILSCSVAKAQPIPEDDIPLSALPFDFDTFCKEKLDNSLYEELRDTEVFRERLLSDTTEFGRAVASELHSLKTTYMVLARNDEFTLYFLQLTREVEGKTHRYKTVNMLVTAKGSNILSVLNQPLNPEEGKVPTFVVTEELSVDIYTARMKQRMFGSIVADGVGWIPVKEDKTATYLIDGKGIFTKCK